MQKKILFFVLIGSWVFSILTSCNSNQNKFSETAIEKDNPEPPDWMFRQRAYPHGQIDKKQYLRALKEKKVQLTSRDVNNMPNWEYRGPDNIGGRITDIAVHSDNDDIIYAGAASGGLFKSTDRGENWLPVFDDALSLSIGDLDIAPSNSSILYVGTGEANGGGGSLTYDGAGIYKSSDSGNTWQQAGLENIGSIGKLVIHPTNPDRVFVAGMGQLFTKNGERGIYRTINGGQNWEQVLFVSDSTGGIDLAIHPTKPDTLYAAMWERIRRPGYRKYGGTTSGIYRTFDGGDNWELLTNGLPDFGVGRIGIAISPSQPSLIYANVIDSIGGLINVYKSEDNGSSWQATGSSGANTGGYEWWFGKIFTHPTLPNKVYFPSLDLYQTLNGGSSWTKISNGVHVDQHALYISPNDPDYMIIGCDGGVYISENAGQNWTHKNNLPITQFYTCEIDYSEPDRLYGGTQDNGTVRVTNGQINGWHKIWGGDGFVAQVDPNDNTFVYVESQYGNMRRSTNGGVGFVYAVNGIDNGGRNWNTPYMLDPNNSDILYLGGRKIYKSTNKAVNWSPISPELVNAPGGSNLIYGTFTSISVSPLNSEIIYAGTDNGRMFVTTNGGNSWQEISAGLPDRWITSVKASPHDISTAYISLSGYQNGEYVPYVLKTENYGQSWIDLSSNLPAVPVNAIILDPDQPAHLYLANDIGVYVSYSDGYSWQILGEGLPNTIIGDLDYHPPTQTLVAATYGRSMYSIELPMVNTTTSSIQGIIQTEIGTKLNSATITIESNIPISSSTDGTGVYTFDQLYSGENYTLSPKRDGDDLNGVSTFDLVLISQHILGVQYLNSPYKVIAADANNSESVTTLDMIAIRKLILSIDTEFVVDSWRFVPEDFVFAHPLNPWEDNFPESLSINMLPASGINNANFVAIKVGDVNLDADGG